jgi:hypothetical protein
MAQRYGVHTYVLGRRDEDKEPHITVATIGIRGALRSYESLSIEHARKLAADLTEELARFDKHQAEART